MEELEWIEGTFISFLYQSSDGYIVARFRLLQQKEIVKVTGYIVNPQEDARYRLKGKYVTHYKYGMQFNIESYEMILPNDADAVVQFLSGPYFPGIGKKKAQAIVDALGDDALLQLQNDPNLAYTLSMLSVKQQIALKEGIEKHARNDVAAFLGQYGLSLKNIAKVEAAYGDKAKDKMCENPYRVVYEIEGIGFKSIDPVGLSMGFDKDHPDRVKAALYTCIDDLVFTSGDAYVDLAQIMQRISRSLPFLEEQDVFAYLEELALEGLIVKENDHYYPKIQYDSEVEIAKFLAGFPYVDAPSLQRDDVLTQLELLQSFYNIEYEEHQKEAICTFFEHSFTIITGGPGTGKTTIVRAIIDLYRDLMPEATVKACAPTGRAAKRLSELCLIDATTIHSLLKWDLETNRFAVDKHDPLYCDLLIVDEFSMVDAFLFARLLDASLNVSRILLIGDEDQLPSVSPGFVLRDLIASDAFSVARLTKIFRQKEGSDIIALANEVKHGSFDCLKSSQEAKFFPCPTDQVVAQILKMVENAFDKGYELNEIQVLAPMYDGVAGINALNRALQEVCNPSAPDKKEIHVSSRIFREQDKVLQLKNLPDEDVYNGDIGTIIEIDDGTGNFEKHKKIVVDFDGILVEYESDNFNLITHAYCISIHKSQGSEYPIVIMPIVKSFQYMLQRRLIYTGITRAKKSLVLLGDAKAFYKGINTEERFPRRTTLQERIEHYRLQGDDDFF